MPLEDIAYTIFVEVLGMHMYPGSPFTGNVVRDMIMFLFIPSVFIILFVYMILGRLFSSLAGSQQKLRILLGIALYLFIIAGGYYPTFALLAGPYFLFLIFILGLIYFIPGHFGFKHEGGHYPERVGKKGRGLTPQAREAYLRGEIRRLEGNLIEARKHGSRDEAKDIRNQIEELRDELEEEESVLRPWRRRAA